MVAQLQLLKSYRDRQRCLANYNALELNVTSQNFHGLTSTVSYTFSKAMNNATDGFRSTGGGGSTIAFPRILLTPARANVD